MDDAVLGVNHSRHLGSLAFKGERCARIIEFIIRVSCIVIQGKMIAIRHIAVPGKRFIFPFDNSGESLCLGLWLSVLPEGARWRTARYFAGL